MELTEGIANGGVLVGQVFQFEESERDAVQEDDDIGAAVRAVFDNGKLIDGGPIVVFRLLKVEEFDEVVNDSAFFAVFDVAAVGQKLVKLAVAFDEMRAGEAGEFADGVGDGLGRNSRIDAGKGFPQAV